MEADQFVTVYCQATTSLLVLVWRPLLVGQVWEFPSSLPMITDDDDVIGPISCPPIPEVVHALVGHMNTKGFSFNYIHIYLIICLCIHIYIHIYIYTHTHIYIYIYMCIYICVYIYLFIYLLLFFFFFFFFGGCGAWDSALH